MIDDDPQLYTSESAGKTPGDFDEQEYYRNFFQSFIDDPYLLESYRLHPLLSMPLPIVINSKPKPAKKKSGKRFFGLFSRRKK